MLHVRECQPEVNHPATHISDNTSLKPVHHIYLIKSSAPNKLQFAPPPPTKKLKMKCTRGILIIQSPISLSMVPHHLVSTFAEIIVKLRWATSQFKLHTVINKTLTNKKVNPIHSYTLAHKNMQDQRTWQTFLTL